MGQKFIEEIACEINITVFLFVFVFLITLSVVGHLMSFVGMGLDFSEPKMSSIEHRFSAKN